MPEIAGVHSFIDQDTLKQISPNYIKESLAIEKDKYNTCSIKIKPTEPDSLKSIPDVEAWNQSKKLIALMYTQKGSDILFIDSLSSVEVIDRVKFDIFFYKIKPANYPLFNVYMLHASYDSHDINIHISFDDSSISLGKQFMEIIRRSKFESVNFRPCL